MKWRIYYENVIRILRGHEDKAPTNLLWVLITLALQLRRDTQESYNCLYCIIHWYKSPAMLLTITPVLFVLIWVTPIQLIGQFIPLVVTRKRQHRPRRLKAYTLQYSSITNAKIHVPKSLMQRYSRYVTVLHRYTMLNNYFEVLLSYMNTINTPAMAL